LLSWTQQQRDCEFIAAPAGGYAPLMASDGFHPGPKVYELWAAEIARRLTDPA
jgi:lysophospholipase L1-like esterase